MDETFQTLQICNYNVNSKNLLFFTQFQFKKLAEVPKQWLTKVFRMQKQYPPLAIIQNTAKRTLMFAVIKMSSWYKEHFCIANMFGSRRSKFSATIKFRKI